MVPRQFVVCLLAFLVLSLVPLGVPGAAEPDAAANDLHGAEHAYVGPGPVHLPAGHLVPVRGIGILSVVDTRFDQVGGYVCQTPPGADPCLPSHPSMGGRVFCNGITLYEGRDWDPDQDLWVWLGSPFDTIGRGHGVTCERPRPATTGYLWHYQG